MPTGQTILRLTQHHLFPRSRLGRRFRIRDNQVNIFLGLHRAWHELVDNATPEEVLKELVWYWLPPKQVTEVAFRTRRGSGTVWPDRLRDARQPQKQEAFQLVFPTQCPLEIMKLWAWQWVPPDYLTELTVVIYHKPYNIYPDTPDVSLITKIKERQFRKLTELATQ